MSIYSLPPALGAAVSLGLGLFVLWWAPKRQTSWPLAAMCFTIVLWLAAYAIAYSTENPRIAGLLARTACTAVAIFSVFLYHFAVEFLGIKKEVGRLVLAYLIIAVLLVGFVWTDLFLAGTYRYFWGFYSRAGLLHPLYLFATFFIWLRSIYLVAQAYHNSRSNQNVLVRNQLKYLLIAYVTVSFATVDYVPKYGVEIYPFGFAFALLFAGIVSYALVRHQLLDIRVAIRKSLAYSLLIASITASYLVMVLIMEKWFQGFFGYRSILATTVVAFLIAIFFNPLRERIQAFVDWALFSATTPELAAQREQLLTEVRKGDQMKAVATLAAGLAHEIKNPLASIKTFTEYLDDHYTDPEFRKKFKKIVGGEVERINLIVQQLLEFAKPVPPKLMPLEVAQVVDDTLEFLGGEFVKRQVAVNRRYDTKVHILGDPQQLKQVFLNLVLNSLDAMNGHGKLDVQTAVEGSDLVVSVADNGSGITPKDLPHVFEPFYTTKSNGTGLGLAVVHGIIKEHGGRIEVNSQPGQGTTMRLYLPIAI